MPPSYDHEGLTAFFETHRASLISTKLSGRIDVCALADAWAPCELFPVDDSDGPARLKHFTVIPSLAAKSSSFLHLRTKVVAAINSIARACGFGSEDALADVFVLVDPEPFLLADKAAKLFYAEVRHLCVLLSVFHLQKHGLESLFTDQVDFLFWGQYLVDVMEYRKTAMQTLLDKSRPAVAVAARAEARAAPAPAGEALEEASEEAEDSAEALEVLDGLDMRPRDDDESQGVIGSVRRAGPVTRWLSEMIGGGRAEPETQADDTLVDTGAEIRAQIEKSIVEADVEAEDELFDQQNAPEPPAAAPPAAAPAPAAPATLPKLGGRPGQEKTGRKINYGRLRYFMLGLCHAFQLSKAEIIKLAREAATELGQTCETDDDVIEWACSSSERFRYLWKLLDNELHMWTKPFLDWDHGNSRTVYAYLPTYTLHFIFYTNEARWRSSRIAPRGVLVPRCTIPPGARRGNSRRGGRSPDTFSDHQKGTAAQVPWLMSHLAATLYRITNRPDLIRTAARTCKHVQDIFIEHLNSVFKRLVPWNTKITAEIIKKVSCLVSARWRLRGIVQRFLGKNVKEPKSELLQDEERITSAPYARTLEFSKAWVVEQFKDELRAVKNGSPTPCVAHARDKAAVGMAWAPSFSKHYLGRLGRATGKEKAPPTEEELRVQDAVVVVATAKYKAELKTVDDVRALDLIATKAALTAMKVTGRGAKIAGKEMNKSQRQDVLIKFLGLAAAAPAPATAAET